MPFELIFLTLFTAATAVALLARSLRVPYTVALVAVGLGLNAVHAFRPPHLTRELLFAVFLPGLIFEAAFHLDLRGYWKHRIAVHTLAIPGVAVSAALAAFVLVAASSLIAFGPAFTVLAALTFGAILSATDPIAVVALFRTLGAPRDLATVLEAESLLNDGTAVVLFTVVAGLVDGHVPSFGRALVQFVASVGGGALVGGAVGFLCARVIGRIDDAMIEITITTLAAYASFVAGERLHVSGVIATVAAGMVCNWFATQMLGPATRVAMESFWQYVAFALNSVVFLLVGFEVRIPELLVAWLPILVAYVAVTLARAVLVFAVGFALRRTRERMPWRWSALLSWGGLRGALSMVLAVGLPNTFPAAHTIETLTFGVAVLSILVQGLTMGPLLRWLEPSDNAPTST